MHKPRERWKPAGAITILDKERLGTVFLYSYNERPAAVAYRGRSTKPELHIVRSTQAEIETSVRRWLDGLRERARQIKAYREQRQQDEWSRNSVIRRIKDALKQRGFSYSVTGGRGTAWGWIHIDLLPSVEKLLTPEKRRLAYRELNDVFGYNRGTDSISVPASTAHYREYLERAQGLTPTKIAEAYWD